MAAKKTATPAKKTLKIGAVPQGFAPVRRQLDGFFARTPGNAIIGTYRGSYESKGGKFGPKPVYRVEVTEGETEVGDGEMIGPGGMVGIDGTGYTKAIGDLEPGTTIFVRYEGKSGDAKEDPHVFTVCQRA